MKIEGVEVMITRDVALQMIGWLDLLYLIQGTYSAGRFGKLETDAGSKIREQKEKLWNIVKGEAGVEPRTRSRDL